MSKIIAIANQKGGVGKTTTCVNLAASLVATKRRVLLIDLDPQGNATVGSGIDKNNLSTTIREVLLNEADIATATVNTASGYDLLAANTDLALVNLPLAQQTRSEYRLKDLLETVRERYDFILIDCPPALNVLTINALAAANSVLIPIQCEYYALEGLTGLMQTIDELRRSTNPELHIEGLLRTMYDGRNRLTQDVSTQLAEHFGDKLYHAVIPRNVRLAEAPSHGLPILQYDARSQGAIAYLALAGEIVRRHQEASKAQTMATD